MSKSQDAFRTISEVAEELEVPKHVLRFWEAKFPQIKPMKRGGGRRYYRPGDMELLRGIRHLLHADGFTIKGVQKILREQGIDAVKHFGRSPGTASAVSDRGRIARRPGAAGPSFHSPISGGGGAQGTEGSTGGELRKLGALADTGRSASEAKARLAHVIAELQECARLLTSDPRTSDTTRSARRQRVVRG